MKSEKLNKILSMILRRWRFHVLMRLGHAINTLSEFTKKLKKYVKENGCNATLKFIKEIIFNPGLSKKWFDEQLKKTPQLRFQPE